jgi:leader peptidase (prepilin peptidase) / N-methyltransferase
MFARIIYILSGWMLGIMINYLADVLPIKRRLEHPFCIYCGSKFHWLEYLFWPRLCHNCDRYRRPRTWIVEAGMMLAGALMAEYAPKSIGVAASLILLAFLVLVTVIDLEHRLIMHIINAVGALGALIIGVNLHGLSATLWGGAAGFLVMLSIYFLGIFFIRISRKLRKQQVTEAEAIGFGDVNLSGVMGLLLGWPGVTLGLLLAVVLAGAVSLLYLGWAIIRKGYSPNLALPYGPFLTVSMALLIFVLPIIQLY